MARLVLLDASPLWLAASPVGKPLADDCRAWLLKLEITGVRVIVPEIADYEVRRELIRRGALASLARLDALKTALPIATSAMLKAAEFWALLRQTGTSTADPKGLDADAILAGQAATAGQAGDNMVIATANLRHLRQFQGIQSELWTLIT